MYIPAACGLCVDCYPLNLFGHLLPLVLLLAWTYVYTYSMHEHIDSSLHHCIHLDLNLGALIHQLLHLLIVITKIEK